MEFDRVLVKLMTHEIDVVNDVLFQHNINAGVIPADAYITPTFLTYRISLGRGVRVGRVTGLQSEFTEALGRSRGRNINVRVTEAPLMIEVPHPNPKPLRYLDVTHSAAPYSLLVGETYMEQRAEPISVDSRETPHVLIAAATGEGKSVLMKIGLLSLCQNNKPDGLRLHLIDLKNADLAELKELPHVDTYAGDEQAALQILTQLDELKKARIDKSADQSVRHILCIDELAELTKNQTAKQLLESLLALGRGLNMNVIAATQHPYYTVVGSLLKANFTVRFVGRVLNSEASKIASGLSKLGAEHLPGKGSFLLVEGGRIVRLQAYFISKDEVKQVVKVVQDRYEGMNGAQLKTQLDQYHRLQRLSLQGTAPAPDVLKYADRPEVTEVFERYYDRNRGEMIFGWQAAMVRTLFGATANRGGWNRQKALEVMTYLRNQPPVKT